MTLFVICFVCYFFVCYFLFVLFLGVIKWFYLSPRPNIEKIKAAERINATFLGVIFPSMVKISGGSQSSP